MNNKLLLGFVLVFISAIGYACLPILIKVAYDETNITPVNLLTWRFILASAFMWMVLLIRQEVSMVAGLNRRQLLKIMLPGFLFAGAALTAFIALKTVPATTFTVLLYTYPAMVAIFLWIMGERISLIKWLAIALALSGCVLVVGGKLERSTAFGMGLVLANSVFYAVYLIISARNAVSQLSGYVFGAMSMTGTLLILLPLAILNGFGFPEGATGWIIQLSIALIGTILPIMTVYKGMRYTGASNAAIISTVEPVITVLLAAIFLKEKIIPIQAAGGLLIMISVLMLQLPTQKPVKLFQRKHSEV